MRPPTRYGNREDQVLWNKKISLLSDDEASLKQKSKTVNLAKKYENTNSNDSRSFNNYLKGNMTSPIYNNTPLYDISQERKDTLKEEEEEEEESENAERKIIDAKRSLDFRSSLKQKLIKNSNKICENIKKLSFSKFFLY